MGPAGEALLEYSIFDALRAGFARIVLVIRPETEEEFRNVLDSRLDQDIKLSYAHQRLADIPRSIEFITGRSKPWGTGHAVLAVEDEIKGPFAVVQRHPRFWLT